MTTDNPTAISSSCHSIATSSSLGTVATSNITTTAATTIRTDNDHGNGYGHYVHGTGSLGRLKYHNKYKSSIDASDDELEYPQLSQSTHLLGRVKSERLLTNKLNEDRRCRTIIVEKQNGSFGFTLQSYGIHYRKDQEVEMITYVDYVEYDGPAFKAGMREGDVILAINGKNMEKADHKTLVDYIKSCDSKMRLVVLFENCVRKVELHMRYIQLQNLLQGKMNELEQVCLRERELLEGRWKTHSLPARKKAIASPTTAEANDINRSLHSDNDTNITIHRSTYSTEDMANIVRQSQQQIIIPPPAQFMFSYHYFDPTYRYVLKPSNSTYSNDDCFITMTESTPRSNEMGDDASREVSSKHQRQTSLRRNSASKDVLITKVCQKHKGTNRQPTQSTIKKDAPTASQKTKHCHGRSCNPCIDLKWKKTVTTAAAAVSGNGDNISLDAYDLASPCCDTQCVPTRRRTRHHSKETHTHKHKHREMESVETKERPPRPKSQCHLLSSVGDNNQHLQQQQQQQQKQQQQHHHHHHHHHHASVTAQKSQHQYHCQASANQKQQIQQQQLLQQQYQQQQHQLQRNHYKTTTQSQAQQQPLQGDDSKNSSLRSRYFDLASGLASHCSLHSCNSSDFKPAGDTSSYTTSFSTDTLFWDPKSDNTGGAQSRQPSIKSRQSYQQPQQQPQQIYIHYHQQPKQQQPVQHPEFSYSPSNMYQHRYHITATHIQPTQIYPNTAFVHKPKSWDNLTATTVNAQGYGYLDTIAAATTIKPFYHNNNNNNFQMSQQQRHSMPRKNSYNRYSTYADMIENYAPPPTEFVEQVTTTTTTITAKSSEDLLLTSAKTTQSSCDCMTTQQQEALKFAQLQIGQKIPPHNHCQMGYYSHLPQPKTDAATSTQNSLVHGMSEGSKGGGAGGASGPTGGNTNVATEATRL